MNLFPHKSSVTTRMVRVSFLEMHNPTSKYLQPQEGIRFKKLGPPVDVDTYRHYYYGVGEKFHWLDRMLMDDQLLLNLINAPNIEIFVMQVNGLDAGYAEFKIEKEFTEIVYFGLLPAFIGLGLGKIFLDWVVNQAWSYHPQWIRLDTCELDHPHALSNYLKRGFTLVRTETHQRKFLDKADHEHHPGENNP